jgi:phage-related protein
VQNLFVSFVIKYASDSIELEIKKFVRSLQKPTIEKTLRAFDLLELYGNRVGLPHSKSMGDGLFELRIRGREEVRFFYTFKNDVIILSAFKKKTKKTPDRELNVAIKRLQNI